MSINDLFGGDTLTLNTAAVTLAEKKFDDALQNATDMLNEAKNFLAQMGSLSSAISDLALPKNITVETMNIPSVDMDEVGEPPDEIEISITPKDPPPDPNLNYVIYDFTDILSADVNINPFDKGDDIVYNPPSFDKTVDVSYNEQVFNDEVDITFATIAKPEVPVLREIPVILSTLITNIENKIDTRLVEGSTGLAADVEAAIWARARSRQELENIKKYEEAENYFSSRGFSLPPGTLSGRLNELLIEFARNDSYLNNDIMVEQAKLAQDNENQILNISTKYLLERLTESANEIISYNKLLIEKYGADVNAYQADIQAEVARVESLVKIYTARIEVFKTKVLAENARIEALIKVYSIYFEEYKTEAAVEMNRVDSLTRIRLSDVEVYKAEVSAESLRVEALIKAFTGQLEAFKAKTGAEASRVEALTRIFLAQIESYKSERGVEVARVDAETKVYLGQIQAYQGRVQAAAAKADALIKGLTLSLQQLQGINAVEVDEAKVNAENLKNSVVVASEIIKAGAQVSAQLAASAMTSVNASANVGGSSNESNSVSQSFNNSYDHTKGTPEYRHQYNYNASV